MTAFQLESIRQRESQRADHGLVRLWFRLRRLLFGGEESRGQTHELAKLFTVCLTLSIALLACGCGGMIKGKKAADKGVTDFHAGYNEGRLADIYSAGDASFKSATTEKQFLDLMQAIQRKLGKATQSANAGFNVSTFNFTTRVVLTQKTTFEQGSATEVFTFKMSGDKAILVGYNINSKDLILR